MREAIGATWIFGIVIVFVTVFTGYLAFSVNYTKAFTMKDEIIDTLEKYNGPGLKSQVQACTVSSAKASRFGAAIGNSTPALCEIYEKMIEVNYNAKGNCAAVSKHLGMTNKRSVTGITRNSIYVYQEHATSFPNTTYNYCLMREGQTYAGSYGTSIGFSSYRVAVFFSIDVHILQMFGNYFVTGETKNITYPLDGYMSEQTH